MNKKMTENNQSGLLSDLRAAVDVALLKPKAMQAVAKDKGKTNLALLILVISVLVTALNQKYFGVFFEINWQRFLSISLFQVTFLILNIYVLSAVAKGIFKGKATHDAFFRVVGFGFIITWLNFFPIISLIATIWSIVLIFSILKHVHKLSALSSILAVLVTIFALIFIHIFTDPVLAKIGIKGYGSELTWEEITKIKSSLW